MRPRPASVCANGLRVRERRDPPVRARRARSRTRSDADGGVRGQEGLVGALHDPGGLGDGQRRQRALGPRRPSGRGRRGRLCAARRLDGGVGVGSPRRSAGADAARPTSRSTSATSSSSRRSAPGSHRGEQPQLGELVGAGGDPLDAPRPGRRRRDRDGGGRARPARSSVDRALRTSRRPGELRRQLPAQLVEARSGSAAPRPGPGALAARPARTRASASRSPNSPRRPARCGRSSSASPIDDGAADEPVGGDQQARRPRRPAATPSRARARNSASVSVAPSSASRPATGTTVWHRRRTFGSRPVAGRRSAPRPASSRRRAPPTSSARDSTPMALTGAARAAPSSWNASRKRTSDECRWRIR